jgi:hypothetical protein
MNTQLRPLTLGEILDRTAELYRTRFLLFAGISTIFAAAMLVIQFLYLRSLYLMGYPNLIANLQWGTAVAAVAEALAIMLLGGLSIVANNRAVAWVYLDQPATIREAARSIKTHLGRYLLLMTTVALRCWTPAAMMYIAYFAVMIMFLPHDFMTNPAATQIAVQKNPAAFLEFGAGILILAPLILAALVFGAIMWLRYSLAVPACVVEELPTDKAIKRSVELSKGSRLRIFVLWLLVALVRGVLGVLFGFPIIVFAVRHQGQPLPMGWMMFSQIGAFLSNALIGPIYAIGVTLFYYDQRIRKEGFDIEWMMHAAGLAPAAELSAGQQL